MSKMVYILNFSRTFMALIFIMHSNWLFKICVYHQNVNFKEYCKNIPLCYQRLYVFPCLLQLRTSLRLTLQGHRWNLRVWVQTFLFIKIFVKILCIYRIFSKYSWCNFTLLQKLFVQLHPH